MKRELLIAEFLSTPWALAPERLTAFAMVLANWQFGFQADDDTMASVRADAQAATARRDAAVQPRGDSIAVLPLYGVVAQRANVGNISGPGATSTQRVGQALRAAVDDPSVRGIVLDIDSPGGSVFGVTELGDQIYQARAQKPVYAIANSVAASAAYWLGSQASQLFVTPSGEVGSIGVFAAHEDYSKALEAKGVKRTLISAGPYKTEGNSGEPLSDDARAFIQSRIDDYYGQFVRAVARGRGTNVAAVREGYGGGRTLGAKDAASAGMVDGVATFDDVVRKLIADTKPKGMTRAAIERRALEISG